ncbi:RNA dependent RNA polymerase-domain-containing protein [Xylariaceae sp. FL0016]|nr:RNA dependent RNA polymerase-domain-containing protein [Xylariaceae sp. FL0016]
MDDHNTNNFGADNPRNSPFPSLSLRDEQASMKPPQPLPANDPRRMTPPESPSDDGNQELIFAANGNVDQIHSPRRTPVRQQNSYSPSKQRQTKNTGLKEWKSFAHKRSHDPIQHNKRRGPRPQAQNSIGLKSAIQTDEEIDSATLRFASAPPRRPHSQNSAGTKPYGSAYQANSGPFRRPLQAPHATPHENGNTTQRAVSDGQKNEIVSSESRKHTKAYPGRGQPQPYHALNLRADWKDWSELTIRVSGVPVHAGTVDLWYHFKRYGRIASIEIDEDNNWARKGSAIVRFSPAPKKKCWGESIMVPFGDDRLPVNVKLLSPREKRSVVSPSGVKYSSQMRIEPMAIEFGVLAQENEFMTMRKIKNDVAEGEFSIELDLISRFKKLELRFACDLKDPRRQDPSITHNSAVGKLEGVAEFKIRIELTHLVKVVWMDNGDDTWCLVISLSNPPQIHQKKDAESSHSDSRSRWDEYDSWHRAVDIMYDSTWLKDKSVSLPRSHQFIDLGRWTTYKVTFARSKLPEWETMKKALNDFNVPSEFTTPSEFSTVPAHTTNFWEILEPQMIPDAPGSNYALLTNSEDIYLPFEVRYQLEACISQGYINEVNVGSDFLQRLTQLSKNSKDSKIHRDRAKDLLTYLAEPYICNRDDNQKKFHAKRHYDLTSVFSNKKAMSHYPDIGIPEHCFWMRKVVITPTTMVLSTPLPEPSNRILRKFKDHADRFLRVQFTDEITRGRIFSAPESSENHAILNRVFRTLKNGIDIGGRHFSFLAFGNSQFRENGAYFFSETGHLTCEDIRQWMGDVKHIRVVAKYAARLGQCFSTTRTPKAFPIGYSIKNIDDIEHNGWFFSDGVGKVSPTIAKHVAEQLRLNRTTVPSAFQFRLGGSKGLLVCWPDVSFNEIHLRPSQQKFKATEKRPEIIKASRFSIATLNRQTIAILSCLGIADEVFVDMLEKQIKKYSEAMKDPEVAMDLLSRFVDQNGITTMIAQMIKDGFMVRKEPFFMTMLQLWRAWSMRLLKEKARIVVDQGAFVFGCVDETKTLRGHFTCNEKTTSSACTDTQVSKVPQIFLQVPLPQSNEYTVIKGMCIVGRNPSLHPGDIRVVEAVDVPELRHLQNVVVFPATGDRDIPSMLSGGDLDGDDFFIIWDPRLIPVQSEWNLPPMMHTPPKPVELERDVVVSDLIGFFVQYMKNDSLASIAHAHLANTDLLPDGPKSSTCLELAQLHSNAVDYNKSGQPALLKRSLRPRQWPHFMEKSGKTYFSTKVLGQLYDLTSYINFSPEYDGAPNERILRRYALADKTLKNARIIKKQHDKAIRQIMNQMEIATEFEVWSTFALNKPRAGNDYKMQENMGHIAVSYRERFRGACIKVAGSREPSVLYPFIAATYRVTWEEVQVALGNTTEAKAVDARRKEIPEFRPMISFPWIFEAELGRIANSTDELELDELPLPTNASRRENDEDEDDGNDVDYERLVNAGLVGGVVDEDHGEKGVILSEDGEATKTAIEEPEEPEEEIVVLEEDDVEDGLDALQKLVG